MNATLIRSYPVDPRHRPEAIAERILPAELRRGRGAATNASGRFELEKREDFDDGWTRDEAPEPLATEVTWEKPKAIITRNELPDIGFDRSINPYRGCEHGCFYCYARPTHAYMGLSAGLDFETRLFAKQGAPPSFWSASWRRPNIGRRRSPSAPTPTPISRSSGSTASPGR